MTTRATRWNWGLTIGSTILAGVAVAAVCGAWNRLDIARDQVTVNTQRLNTEEAATKSFVDQIKALSEQLAQMQKENSDAHGTIEKALGKVQGLLEGHVGKSGAGGAMGDTANSGPNN
jgi:uncharacterized protein YlxW (UPF0749 family)